MPVVQQLFLSYHPGGMRNKIVSMYLLKEGNRNWSELTTKGFSLRMRCDLLLNAEKPCLFLLVIILRMGIQEFPLRNNCQLCWEYFFRPGSYMANCKTIEIAE